MPDKEPKPPEPTKEEKEAQKAAEKAAKEAEKAAEKAAKDAEKAAKDAEKEAERAAKEAAKEAEKAEKEEFKASKKEGAPDLGDKCFFQTKKPDGSIEQKPATVALVKSYTHVNLSVIEPDGSTSSKQDVQYNGLSFNNDEGWVWLPLKQS